MGRITYQHLPRWKYRTIADYTVNVPILDKRCEVPGGYACLDNGSLLIRSGYAWDGVSGPLTLDTRNVMRASLVHDALYQMMRESVLDLSYRLTSDRLYRDHMLEDGASRARAWVHYRGLRLFGAKYARATPPPPTHQAP